MTLIQLLLVVAVTAAVCALAGASPTTTAFVTIVMIFIVAVVRSALFPNPWNPIERVKRQFPSDHSLMVEAKRRAVDSLPQFWSLCANGVPLDAKVRVQLINRNGESEDLWMFLLALPDAESRIHVHLCDAPQLSDYDFYETGDVDFYVHTSQIVDWSLEQTDATIRGTFTTFALFELFEQSVGPLPKRTNALRERFLDARDL